MTKECKVCKAILPYSMFGKRVALKDGRENTCKSCRLIRRPKLIKVCNQCEVEYITDRKTSKFCDVTCMGLYRMKRVNKECVYCGKTNEVVKSKAGSSKLHFCNQSCKTEYMKVDMLGDRNPNYNRVEYKCDGCHKNIKVEPFRINMQRYIFCNNNCYKENIGKYYSGINNNFYNHNLTDEERLSTRRYKEYYEWRLSVYERDKFTCKKCGDDKGGNLIAHHILNYSEHHNLRTELDNGITLCVNCHKDFHNKYGYRNNNQMQLNNYLQRIPIPQ